MEGTRAPKVEDGCCFFSSLYLFFLYQHRKLRPDRSGSEVSIKMIIEYSKYSMLTHSIQFIDTEEKYISRINLLNFTSVSRGSVKVK